VQAEIVTQVRDGARTLLSERGRDADGRRRHTILCAHWVNYRQHEQQNGGEQAHVLTVGSRLVDTS
jgi:hypothetical protein